MSRAVHRNAAWAALPALALALVISGVEPSPAEAAACKNAGKGVHKLSQNQARGAIKCQINKQRRGMRNLKRSGELTTAAQRHTRKMAKKNCFSHQCAGEPDLTGRVRRTGYLRGSNGPRLGEVIAVNVRRAKPRKIVRQWIRSAPHRRILRGGFRHIGIGVALKGRRAYFTAVVGKR